MAWSSRDVRALLRNLRKPDVLERLPLAILLKSQFAVHSGYEATMHLIKESFAARGQAGERLREVLVRYDLDGQVNRDVAATQMGLSSRQFFRYRAHAVEMIAQHLRSTLGAEVKPENTWVLASILAQHDPQSALSFCGAIDQLDSVSEQFRLSIQVGHEANEALFSKAEKIDPAVTAILKAHSLNLAGRYEDADALIQGVRVEPLQGAASRESRACIERELVIMDLQRAFERGDASRAGHLTVKLRNPQFSAENPYNTHALLYDAQIAVTLGELERAEHAVSAAEDVGRISRNLLGLAWCMLIRAEIGFSRGEYGSAQQFANAARIALAHHPVLAAAAHALLGRIALALNVRWERPSEPYENYRYRQIELDLISARHLLANNAIREAERLAQAALEVAQSNRFIGLESYALATLASIATQKSDCALAQVRYVEAWRISASLHNALLCRDLFCVPRRTPAELGPIFIDDGFANALAQTLATAFPEMPLFKTEQLRASFGLSLATLIRDAVSADNVVPLRSPEMSGIAQQLIEAKVSGQSVIRSCADVAATLSATLAPLLPASVQSRLTRKLREAVEEMFEAIGSRMMRPITKRSAIR